MRVVAVIFFLPILALAQGTQVTYRPTADLQHYLAVYSRSDGKEVPATAEFLNFAHKLDAKKGSFKNEKVFLHYLFAKTHQRFLKHYTEYASFGQLLTDGTYNCLTGTALYGLLLERFNIDFKIIETNYHIFLVANTAEGKVLFEATDPTKGFVDDPAEIENRISTYRKNAIRQGRPDKTYYRFNFELYNEVSLDQMLGLLHYNLAIVAFNKHQFASAINHLDDAIALYHSPRIEEFSKVVLLSIVESQLEASVKETYVRKIQSIRKKKAVGIASDNAF